MASRDWKGLRTELPVYCLMFWKFSPRSELRTPALRIQQVRFTALFLTYVGFLSHGKLFLP
jgi:hypothetical protein